MKAIVTRARADGSFDEVGMNNRTIIKGRREGFVIRRAREYAAGRESVRLEWLSEYNPYAPAVKIQTLPV